MERANGAPRPPTGPMDRTSKPWPEGPWMSPKSQKTWQWDSWNGLDKCPESASCAPVVSRSPVMWGLDPLCSPPSTGRPSTHECCSCPLASLPRGARTPHTSLAQDGGVWRVLTNASDVGGVAQGQGAREI